MRALNPLWSSIVLAAVCTQAQGITLSEAIQSPLDNHPEVHAGANSRLSSDEDVRLLKVVICQPSTCSWATVEKTLTAPVPGRWATTTPIPSITAPPSCAYGR